MVGSTFRMVAHGSQQAPAAGDAHAGQLTGVTSNHNGLLNKTLPCCGRAQQLRFQNGEICRLTEQVIFTDPYHAAPANRHTSPQLDDLAAAFCADAQAKAAITALKVCTPILSRMQLSPSCHLS